MAAIAVIGVSASGAAAQATHADGAPQLMSVNQAKATLAEQREIRRRQDALDRMTQSTPGGPAIATPVSEATQKTAAVCAFCSR